MLLRRCSIVACEKDYYSRGLCTMHYQRLLRYGSPKDGKTTHAAPLIRFMRRVEKTAGCWLWRGVKSNKTGYGSFQAGGKGSPVIGAHRFSYQAHKGPVPKGLHVRHTCDVRLCVNPAHLVVGTHIDNMADMRDRGRRAAVAKGEAVKSAILTEGDVRIIRSHPKKYGLFVRLAAQFGVDKKTIADAHKGKTWAHVK